MIGIGRARRTSSGAVLGYRLHDIAAAAARVRGAGGTAADSTSRPYGLEADCTDDQESPFYLHEFPPESLWNAGRP